MPKSNFPRKINYQHDSEFITKSNLPIQSITEKIEIIHELLGNININCINAAD